MFVAAAELRWMRGCARVACEINALFSPIDGRTASAQARDECMLGILRLLNQGCRWSRCMFGRRE